MRPEGPQSEKGDKDEKKLEKPEGPKREKGDKDEKKTVRPEGPQSEKGDKDERKTEVPAGPKKGDKTEQSKRKKKDEGEEETATKKKKKKEEKEPPVKFEEAKKDKIEHIFQTPERKTRNTSPPPAGEKMTVKQRAEERLQELTKHLAPSDFEEDSSCPATDLENLMLCPVDSPRKTACSSEEDEGSEDDNDDEGSDEEGDKDEDENEDEEEKEEPDTSDTSSSEETEEDEDDDDEGEEQEEAESDEDDEDHEEEPKEVSKKKEAEKSGDGTDPTPETHALVPVTAHTQKQVATLKNSVTNKREWDTFCRQAKSRMPVSLNEMYQASKQELFNMWLDAGQDWTACALECERRHEQKKVATRGWRAEQGKVLKERYSPEKWQTILASRKLNGLYYEDPDFPGDDDEPWLFVIGKYS